MADLEPIEVGSRHDLRSARSPDAPDTLGYEGREATFGWVHSYETGSTVDGPGVRITLFMSGCLLRCQYCHNPDTWHLKDGTRVELAQAIRRLGEFAPMLRAMEGGLTISGGEPLVQIGFTRGMLAAAKRMGLHTAIETSGFLGARADDAYLANLDMVILDIKSGDPETYLRLTGKELEPTLRFAERLNAMNKPVWVRFVLAPGVTDAPDNIEKVARFVAPMKNVEWVEVLPFHQMGAFKWKALGIDYRLADTPPPTPEQVRGAIEIFRKAGCNAR
ncbi:MAG: pyruvate formate lyase-activating protein [Proteobacteria bacterium]|nr:pyruvate formate lyase-activating protein [Pseudomonadota bacterium]